MSLTRTGVAHDSERLRSHLAVGGILTARFGSVVQLAGVSTLEPTEKQRSFIAEHTADFTEDRSGIALHRNKGAAIVLEIPRRAIDNLIPGGVKRELFLIAGGRHNAGIDSTLERGEEFLGILRLQAQPFERGEQLRTGVHTGRATIDLIVPAGDIHPEVGALDKDDMFLQMLEESLIDICAIRFWFGFNHDDCYY